MKQAKLLSCQPIESNLPKDDIQVTWTILNVPAFLVKEFAERVARLYYTGGICEAIKDLVWQAVQTHKLEQRRHLDNGER